MVHMIYFMIIYIMYEFYTAFLTMIEVLLDVCGHYSSTYRFRNSEGIEREREGGSSERKFCQNNVVKKLHTCVQLWSLCLLFIEDHQGLWLTFWIEKIKGKRKLSGRPRHCGNKACHFSNFPFPTLLVSYFVKNCQFLCSTT